MEGKWKDAVLKFSTNGIKCEQDQALSVLKDIENLKELKTCSCFLTAVKVVYH